MPAVAFAQKAEKKPPGFYGPQPAEETIDYTMYARVRQFIQDPMDYETRVHHSDMDVYDRLHEADLEQAAVVEAIFLWNTSQREEMMPRKPYPHPELEKQKTAPLVGIYPNAVK